MNRALFKRVKDVFNYKLTEAEIAALLSFPDKLQELAIWCRKEIDRERFFTRLPDELIPEELKEDAGIWRGMAKDLGYAGPIAWHVRRGYTPKESAPVVWPVGSTLRKVIDWELAQLPTEESSVLWIPRFVPGSEGKRADAQLELLEKWRKCYGLPEGHLANFGGATVLIGLIVEYYNEVLQKLNNRTWIMTDTISADGRRLMLGGCNRYGLQSRWLINHCPTDCAGESGGEQPQAFFKRDPVPTRVGTFPFYIKKRTN